MCELCRTQELEKAHKALSLNGDTSPISSYNQNFRLLSASSNLKKPTLWIKKLKFGSSKKPTLYIKKLRSASIMPCKEKEKAEKAMNLNYGF